MRLTGLDPDQRQRRFLVAAATAFEFERHVNLQEAESLEEYADLFMERFPPMVTAKAVLGERFQELRERIVGIWRDANEAKGRQPASSAGVSAHNRPALRRQSDRDAERFD